MKRSIQMPIDVLRNTCATALGDLEALAPSPTKNFARRARARWLITAGRRREGLDVRFEFGRRDEAWGAANPWPRAGARTLRSRSPRSMTPTARELAAEDLDRARRWGAASGIGVALRAVALVEAGSGTIERLRESAEVLAGSPSRLEEGSRAHRPRPRLPQARHPGRGQLRAVLGDRIATADA